MGTGRTLLLMSTPLFCHCGLTLIGTSSLVFVTNPKFAELTSEEQKLYHYDQEIYNNVARKGRKSLYFARSMQEGETWVPLIEKAYAKLHGDYAALSGGKAREATEDLTGGVCSEIPIIVWPSEPHPALRLNLSLGHSRSSAPLDRTPHPPTSTSSLRVFSP